MSKTTLQFQIPPTQNKITDVNTIKQVKNRISKPHQSNSRI